MPAPAQGQASPQPQYVKSKRGSVRLNPAPAVDPHQATADANRRALEEVYRKYYRSNGTLRRQPFPPPRPDGKHNQALYNLLAKGAAGYATTGITQQDVVDLTALPGVRVTSQKVDAYQSKNNKYQQQQAAYNANPTGPAPKQPRGPKDFTEALARGDYFHLHNEAFKGSSTRPKGNARRIVVNVKTQQDGLDVAKALAPLFGDSEVGPNFRQFKIYLSSGSKQNTQVKDDKLVLYYTFAGDPGRDRIGNKLAAAVVGAVGPGAVVDSFAPFYSHIGHGMAWAEEPTYYVSGLPSGASFTEARTLAVEQALRNNPSVTDVNDFIDKVNQELLKSQIDPDRPQTHLRRAKTRPTGTTP